MKISSAKAKGRRCATELKLKLMASAPTLREGDIEVTSSSVTGEDLKLSPAAREVYPFAIECKNVESLNVWSAMKQAETHAEGTTRYPLLAFKRNSSPMYVTMRIEDFLCLMTTRSQN